MLPSKPPQASLGLWKHNLSGCLSSVCLAVIFLLCMFVLKLSSIKDIGFTGLGAHSHLVCLTSHFNRTKGICNDSIAK